MWRDAWIRLRSVFRSRHVEVELDDELRFHRERQYDQYVRSGLSPAEARRRVGLEFGGLDQVKEECRNARGVTAIEHLMQDIRYGVRSLARARGFTLISVLTLALGIGANTAIFSVVYSVLLRPLPYPDPSSIVLLRETTDKVGQVSVSIPDYLDWRNDARTIAEMCIVADTGFNLAGGSEPQTVGAEAVASECGGLLGIRPVIGRGFTAAEDRAGTAPVALLTYGLWQSHFAADPAVLGRSVSLDGRPVTVIGVLPREYRPLHGASLVVPLGMWLTDNDGALNRGDRGDTVVVARLRPGVTMATATTEMDGIAARLAAAYPATNAGFGVALTPIREEFIGGSRSALWVLFGAVGCVLLIACANVANLCLIRGAGRTREIALRVAIGAGRGRIVSQLLVEGALLAAAGGVLGVGVAIGGLRALSNLVADGTFGTATIALSAPVLVFTAVVVLASTVLFALAPALQSARVSLHADLKEGGRSGTAGQGQQRWRSVLAAAEVALALVLLVGAGLMTRSLSHLMAVDPGIRTQGVLTLGFQLADKRYDANPAKRQFWEVLLERTRRLPGVETVAIGSGVPLTNDHSRSDITPEGFDFAAGALPHPDVHVVSPDYAKALGIRVLSGRVFTDADNDNAPRVGLINRAIAEKFYANEDPVGRRFTFGRPGPDRAPAWITIVGVLDDTRMYGLDNPSRLEVYVPLAQRNRGGGTLIVRAATDPASLLPSIRAAVAEIDPSQPIAETATLDELLTRSVSTRRATFMLLALFSGLSLALAVIGIYGVMSHAVAQRTNEIGIRLALGAPWIGLVIMVVRQGLVIALAGIAIGLGAALGLTRLMGNLLFAVSATDPMTFAAAVAGVALTAAAACAIPGWRAARVDPLIALRRD
jgi:putative ABC transport system permease protein